jgi:predicted nuclease of predicted toxin-antitoxin system
MKILIDMNLSPDWREFFEVNGLSAVHWSTVGNPRAPDTEILDWARERGFIIFTHDLDFGYLLAMTRAAGPSVLQVRTQDVLPDRIGEIVLSALHQYKEMLDAGALVSLDPTSARARILPILRAV